jgi:GxxExxY protein
MKALTCETMETVEDGTATKVVDAIYLIYRKLGPGLLESVYETVLSYELERQGLTIRRQVPLPLVWNELKIEDSFRVDLIVEGVLLVELKSLKYLSTVIRKEALTHWRFSGLKRGLLVNFGASHFEDCVLRLTNGL